MRYLQETQTTKSQKAESAKQEEQERTKATSDARKSEGQHRKAPTVNKGTSNEENIRQQIPTVVVGLQEREERGTLQKIKDWSTNLMEEKIDKYRSQSMPNQDLKEYQDMMRLMIEKTRLEEPTRATGGSSGSGGDLHKASRWNHQRSKSQKEDSGGEALCVESSSEEDRVTQETFQINFKIKTKPLLLKPCCLVL